MSAARPDQSQLHCDVELPRDVGAPGVARRSIAACFGSTLGAEMLTLAKLLTSELVTNAVVHGRGRITLSAQANDERLLVEVEDEGAGFERAATRRASGDAGGWGLGLVEAESSRWGAYEGTTHVWFELARLRDGQNPVRPPAGCAGRLHRS
ncbi:MAG: serine/threonine-protein kinase RsbW [Solirubrobacteraceae bacterium]|nr:serine/threonine-protein kinase RsbW [Solirubrobacteraceae bacterium]